MRALEGVRDLRERRMLTQQELADRAGVSLFTVQRIERGEGSVRPKTGRAIAGALSVGVEDLLGKVQAPLPDFKIEGERREAVYDVVMAAARHQVKQDRQAANRAHESERPQTYFMRHDNEVVHRLLGYSSDELAEALIEMGRRCVRLEEALAAAAPGMEYDKLLEAKGFSPEQIAAHLAQEERDQEFIQRELEKMSTKDIKEALMASPGMRRVRDSYRENNPHADEPPRSETA
ncbi:MAG: helix-turn-helix domain-containing protein [Actinomycetota bacterium]|nr:helix-turn-helix domain-containing protein [Actinomycetota bacterium]